MPLKTFYFFLLMCFKSIPYNKVLELLFEVSQLGLYEAFLEAGPQAILQFSIIIRTGYIAGISATFSGSTSTSKHYLMFPKVLSILSIAASIFSLAFASSKAFYAHRLARNADPDPPLCDFVLPLLLPYALVVVPNVVARTVILSYAGPWNVAMIVAGVVVRYQVARVTRPGDGQEAGGGVVAPNRAGVDQRARIAHLALRRHLRRHESTMI